MGSRKLNPPKRRVADSAGATGTPAILSVPLEAGPPAAWWSLEAGALARRLGSGADGLTSEEAAARLKRHGPNALKEFRPPSRLAAWGRQLRSPLVLLLLFAAAVAAFTGQWVDAGVVLSIVVLSAGLGATREHGAQRAAEALKRRIRTRTQVLRDRRPVAISIEEVVPGDVVLLSAGSLVPADALLLEAQNLFASEAALTGESFPAEKRPGAAPPGVPLAARFNCVFQGTNVRSGTARALVVRTGPGTEFGTVAERLSLRPPETEFDRGLRRFGGMLTVSMLVLVILVFAAHVLGGRPPAETLLFAVALAVGLSPELLPAILSVNLARGAAMMARRGVLVRRLSAIENLGSMDVLCTDKTGTLTEGVVRLEGSYGPGGAPSEEPLALAALNAALETGLGHPLDDAILAVRRPDLSRVEKLAEIPFDSVRKRVGVVVREGGKARIVVKGAFRGVLAACAPMDPARRAALEVLHDGWSAQGVRALAVASRKTEEKPSYGREDERDMDVAGFVTFLDRPKEGAAEAARDLAGLGVAVKLITGDNRLVARHAAALVGLRTERTLTGGELNVMRDEALWREAERTDIFAEVDPHQKERILLALKKTGHVVGFLGDGVNDAPAMHAADAALSVEGAVDVAREAADFVLLEKGLDVIRRGVEEGRRTFANTLKYVLTTTSANWGNMLSMAAASLFLPFLPLTAGQILLNNFLSDVPAVGFADDDVDPELVARPRRWDMGFIGRFMVEFGLLSSLFDVAAFGVLLGLFRAGPAAFQTGWFTASLLTELAVALVVRTRRPFWRSRPGSLLSWTTAAVAAFALALPYVKIFALLGFVPLPWTMMTALCGVTAGYVAATEVMKRWFYVSR